MTNHTDKYVDASKAGAPNTFHTVSRFHGDGSGIAIESTHKNAKLAFNNMYRQNRIQNLGIDYTAVVLVDGEFHRIQCEYGRFFYEVDNGHDCMAIWI